MLLIFHNFATWSSSGICPSIDRIFENCFNSYHTKINGFTVSLKSEPERYARRAYFWGRSSSGAEKWHRSRRGWFLFSSERVLSFVCDWAVNEEAG